MNELKEINLPSGAVLKISLAPFAISKALAQAVLVEFRKIEFSQDVDHWALTKDIICTGLASKEIEAALKKCMERCTYNDVKITDDTWESAEARGDYVIAVYNVLEENVQPFLSGLLPDFAIAKKLVLAMIYNQKSSSTTSPSSTGSDYVKPAMQAQ